ncbi:MAG: methyltransferase, partial [Candidatus Tectomicrobia bacterium]|nr:methyltransferase [Candidatus Tectomicrobia bacterium]
VEAVKRGRAGLRVSPPFFVNRESGDYSTEMKGVYELEDPLVP